MSWRRGELWLDTDLLWFREGTGASALVGFAPASIPAFASPPGLSASRQRRAAWKRRRFRRRARATALMLSPALIFPVASARSGGSQGQRVVAEDPPSQTFGLSRLAFGATAASVPWTAGRDRERETGGLIPTTQPKQVRRALAGVTAFPKVEWQHAVSIGLPYAGTLIRGTQLPVDGPDWVTWDPVTDSVPNAPNRLYGNERTIRAIISVTGAYRAANPGAPPVVIGDISREGGGPMTDEHVSHQNGLDVDVYYPRLDRALRAPVATDEIDRPLAQDLLDRFVAAGAQMVFVGYSTGLHGASGVVIPYANHEFHMHVRFPPPAG